jgi:mannose-6-phosphate isomerase-like protein (cupin superfamily)
MQKGMLATLAAVTLVPVMAFAQAPKAATYITDEEIKKVNTLPGVDRQIRIVDIGHEQLAVGIIHRVAPTPGRGAGAAGGAGAARGAAPPAPAAPCGDQAATPPTGGTPGGITHDSQTEGYVIVSGGGTLVTGGRIVNGRQSAPDSEVTRVLNGPSCSGTIVGDDVVKRVLKAGDVVIIPANVPHAWIDITDHVDYMSIRPTTGGVIEKGYVNPAIK